MNTSRQRHRETVDAEKVLNHLNFSQYYVQLSASILPSEFGMNEAQVVGLVLLGANPCLLPGTDNVTRLNRITV